MRAFYICCINLRVISCYLPVCCFVLFTSALVVLFTFVLFGYLPVYYCAIYLCVMLLLLSPVCYLPMCYLPCAIYESAISAIHLCVIVLFTCVLFRGPPRPHSWSRHFPPQWKTTDPVCHIFYSCTPNLQESRVKNNLSPTHWSKIV